MGTRRPMPEASYNWPGGPTADDDPTPLESALAALKYGAILAAGITIALIYLGTYAGLGTNRVATSLIVLAAFLLPSGVAMWRTAWVRRRRPPGNS